MNTRKVGTRTSGAMIALVVFFVNPLWLLACLGAAEPDPINYTAQDMERELSEAARTYTAGGDEGSLEMTIAVKGLDAMAMIQPPAVTAFLQEANACGYEHSFVAGASACVSTPGAQMEFEGTVTVTWIPAEGEPVILADGVDAQGTYLVPSTELDTGSIDLFGVQTKDGASANVTLDSESGDGADFNLKGLSFYQVPDGAEGYSYEVRDGEFVAAQ